MLRIKRNHKFMPAFLNTLIYPTISITILFLVGCSRDNPLSVPGEYEEPVVKNCEIIVPDILTLTDINITDSALINVTHTPNTFTFINTDGELDSSPVPFDYEATVDHLINSVVITPVPMSISADILNEIDALNGIDALNDSAFLTKANESLSELYELINNETSGIFGIKEFTSLEIKLNGELLDPEDLSSRISLVDETTNINILVRTQFEVLVNEEQKGKTKEEEDRCVPVFVKNDAGKETTEQVTEQQIQVLSYTIEINRNQPNELTTTTLELASDISVANDEFGRAISIGSTLVTGDSEQTIISLAVGTPHATTTFNDSGAVYIYEQISKGNWGDAALISAAKPDPADLFGYSVSFSEGFLAVSAPGEDSFSTGVFPFLETVGEDADGNEVRDGININIDVEISNVAESSGAVYLFQKNINEPSGWRQSAFIKQPTITLGLENYDIGFGTKVLLKGNLLLIAAPQQQLLANVDDVPTTINSGVVYAYRYNSSSDSWSFAATLKSETPNSNDRFGSSLAIHDGFILVGAPGENNGAGGAHLFAPSGNNWLFDTHITASNSDPSDSFGNAVAIGPTKIFIGASKENSFGLGFNRNKEDNSLENSGAVYGYSIKEPEDPWVEFVYIKSDSPMNNAQFGYEIQFENSNLFIGEPFRSNGNALGQVYFYELMDDEIQPSTIIPYESIESGTAINNGRFGSSLALFNSIFAVGANGFTNNESGVNKTNSGKAYIFQ
jgi:hypothetical protein